MTLRFQLLSDLHLERDPSFQVSSDESVDILLLAGDIGSYQSGSRLTDSDFGLSRFKRSAGPWKHVVFVPGNHEYDQMDFAETHARLCDICASFDIIILERSSVVIDDVRILGTTLWSDFDALRESFANKDEVKARALREKAYRAANFYLKKYSTLIDGVPMLAEQMRALSIECQKWLIDELHRPFGGKTLVVTHFAPSLKSADPRYGISPGSAGFCNSLDHLFPLVDVWAHGHLHCPNVYQVGRCKVVSNSLGYKSKGEQEGFIPRFEFDL